MVKAANVDYPREAWLIADRMKRHLDAESIYLFGSYARGEAGSDSDMDFAVVVPDDTDSRYRRSVRARSLVGDIHVPKDILVFTRAEWEAERLVVCSLVDTIEREGVRLDV